MKKLFLIIVIAIFGMMAVGAFPAQITYAYAEDDKNKDKGKDKKKDPAGPPVMKDKGPKSKDRDKDRPKKGKKPD
jgi:hypothetical protein